MDELDIASEREQISMDAAIADARSHACNICGTSEYYSSGRCKCCSRKKNAEWKKLNAEKVKIDSANYYKKNKELIDKKNAEWAKANPEKSKEYGKKYSKNNKEKLKQKFEKYKSNNVEKIKAKNLEWISKNKERRAKTHSIYYENNKEMLLAKNKAWASNNRESRRIDSHNRRAKEKDSGSLSKGLSTKLFKLQRGKCACCGKPLGDNYHLDHIMPIALGGPNTDDNIQLLRAKCNIQKHAKHPVDFMQSRGFLL